MRTFIAIDLPSETIQKIQRIVTFLKTQIPIYALKWVSTENLHLTIKFIGDISISKSEQLKTTLSTCLSDQEAFDIAVEGLGMYPHVEKPRVIWLGITNQHPLIEIHQKLEHALATIEIKPDPRKFTPHLTIARVHRNTPNEAIKNIGETLSQFKIESLGIISVETICLYQSELRPQGPIYTPMLSVPLIKV